MPQGDLVVWSTSANCLLGYAVTRDAICVWFYHALLSPWRWATGCIARTGPVQYQSPQSEPYCSVIRGMGIGIGIGIGKTRTHGTTGAHPLQKGDGPFGAIGREATHHQPVPYGKPPSPLFAAPAHEGRSGGQWVSQLQPDGRSSRKAKQQGTAKQHRNKKDGPANGLRGLAYDLAALGRKLRARCGVVGWVVYEKYFTSN